jgi:hypothetical protein
MAVSPQDIALSEKERSEADRHERTIDGLLERGYVEGGTISLDYHFTITDTRLFTPSEMSRVQNEVLRRFRAAGWEVVRKPNNGPILFTPRK